MPPTASKISPRPTSAADRQGSAGFAAYCIAAAFVTYFCMYAFRKPFSAGVYEEVTLMGIGYKTVLVMSQVAGYTISKFIGIKVISEMPPARRAVSIMGLILVAHAALLLFAIVPPPYNWPFLFLNGLPLGMIFGLVLSFLEGRRMTEALTAGLCASFILASGVVKSVGRSLVVDGGVSEYWMPFVTGLLFLPPVLIGAWLLGRIPPPDAADIAMRSPRSPMTRDDRWRFFQRHAFGLSGLVVIYVLLTIIRTLRDDFGVEIWRELDPNGQPSIFFWTEAVVVLGVLLVNGSAIFIRDNRKAFLGSFALLAGGFVLVLAVLSAFAADAISPFAFMIGIGIGTYVPYVAFHTTVFERMIALFRERANIGYLMYLADATGYLAAVLVLVSKDWLVRKGSYLELLKGGSFWLSVASLVITLALFAYYTRLHRIANLPASELVVVETA
ncbi:DUF5690 family protein [Aeoliella sp. SH292]|uniref:DUF5690 family protein n=1 Tax=Aeoliella sp. SH292 TaxID=3454464 RepID=UPI003F9B88C0